jgi:serine/threonine protein kinase
MESYAWIAKATVEKPSKDKYSSFILSDEDLNSDLFLKRTSKSLSAKMWNMFADVFSPLSKNQSIEDYQLQRILGRGSQGTVRLMKKLSSQELVVLKECKCEKGTAEEAALENEIKLIQRMTHPNIVKYENVLKAGEMQNQIIYYLGMKYYEEGDLSNVIKKRIQEENPFSCSEVTLGHH